MSTSKNRNILDSKGYLTINLYHGTSSIFLPSIQEHGLGGCSIFEKYDLRSLFSVLCNELEENSDKSEWWMLNDFLCKIMIENKVSPGGMNFRYGETYLTPSIETATRYAESSEYGSEYLSTFVAAFEAVKDISVDTAERVIPPSSPLQELISSPRSPLLISVSNVHKDDLSTESDRDLEEQLEQIKNDHEVLWQQSNFSINRTISFDQLTIETL